MEEMRVKYMGKALNNLNSCGQSLFPISEKITSLEGKVSAPSMPPLYNLSASSPLPATQKVNSLLGKDPTFDGPDGINRRRK